MVYITEIHVSPPGDRHERIAAVRWRNPSTGQHGACSTSAMVEFIQNGNQVQVTDGRNTVAVAVVEASPRYLRTVADGYYTDNLLALPRY